MINSNKGFTLLEVLVAGTILFSVVATTSLIYQNVMRSMQLSEKHMNISTAVPFLLDEIRDEIWTKGKGRRELVGEGRNIGVNFYWEAEVVDFMRPQQSALDDKNEKVTQKFKLWLVKLKLTDKDYTKEYQYRELSWEVD